MNLETRNIFKRGGDGAPRDDVGVKRKERRITKRRSTDNRQSTDWVNIDQSALKRQRFVLCDTFSPFWLRLRTSEQLVCEINIATLLLAMLAMLMVILMNIDKMIEYE